ncbi:MAG: CHC2 zinc finger domain-containing protein [Sedimenticola sp.]
MRPVDNLLDRLEGVRKTSDRKYMARCPAHDDKSPSLSISETDNGTVLIHCFSGCEAESVLNAVGLGFPDLYPGDPSKAAHQAAIYHRGKWYERTLEQREIDITMLKMARAAFEAGQTLSIADQAELKLAMVRLKGDA